MRKPPRVLVIWGVPGVGKSTFAAYLVEKHGYTQINSDAQGAGDSRAAKAWRAVLAVQGRLEMADLAREFVKVARYDQQPVVLEFGMFANEGGIHIARAIRDAGAEVWWFDGDHAVALAAWQRANPFVSADVWHRAVGVLDANVEGLKAFFGDRMVRTLEAGPLHVPPEDTFKRMFPENT